MSQIPNANAASSSNQAFGKNNSLNELGIDDFLNLMIAELQNQDPLNPLENDELIAQIGQIREVGATEALTQTLNAVLLGQNISSATNLIGADVVALTDTGERVTGNVRVVSIIDGQPRLDIAVEPVATTAKDGGEIAEGTYTYEVVWDTKSGDKFGIELKTSTSSLTDFDGSIRLNNLPETSTEKRVYRTDNSGEGNRLLVGVLPQGRSTSFVDTKSDKGRIGEPLTGRVQKVDFADRITVSLNNVGEIRPPQ